MKIRTIALNTFTSFLHTKVMVVAGLPFVLLVLMGVFSVLLFRAKPEYIGSLLHDIAATSTALSALGSLLAAFAAADTLSGEMRSGTVLAVMARPLQRWQFLAGKYCGVLLLMLAYTVAMLGAGLLLDWLAGLPFHTPWWILIVYPFVRYAVWAAIALLLVTFLHPIVTMAVVAVIISVIRILVSPGAANYPAWIRIPLHVTLPFTTTVLSEDRFFSMTLQSLHRYPWTFHATALAYGLNYALVCFLLAAFLFHRRSLATD
jgi:ABC-type transport system involved in multi-copper enzyme maturation permease subunit